MHQKKIHLLYITDPSSDLGTKIHRAILKANLDKVINIFDYSAYCKIPKKTILNYFGVTIPVITEIPILIVITGKKISMYGVNPNKSKNTIQKMLNKLFNRNIFDVSKKRNIREISRNQQQHRGGQQHRGQQNRGQQHRGQQRNRGFGEYFDNADNELTIENKTEIEISSTDEIYDKLSAQYDFNKNGKIKKDMR